MTDKEIIALLDHALEQAFVAQFVGLFSVLYVAENPEQGLERFERGLTKLLNTGTAVAKTIRTMENGSHDHTAG